MADVEAAWAALAAEGSWRSAQIEKQEGEHRRKHGAPVHVSEIAADALADAEAEWARITGGGPDAEPADDDEGDEGDDEGDEQPPPDSKPRAGHRYFS